MSYPPPIHPSYLGQAAAQQYPQQTNYSNYPRPAVEVQIPITANAAHRQQYNTQAYHWQHQPQQPFPPQPPFQQYQHHQSAPPPPTPPRIYSPHNGYQQAPMGYPQQMSYSQGVAYQQQPPQQLPPPPQQPTPPLRPPQPPSRQSIIASSPSVVITKPSPSQPKPPPTNYSSLLLSLADEYLNAAHNYFASGSAPSEDELSMYYKLVATALGCMESVLKNCRLEPRLEAVVRLRYATTLHEETDNDMEAEEVLNKGITLCDRNRLLDLRYHMSFLLCQVLFKSNPKACMKTLDRLLEESRTLRHLSWNYAFRFLRVSLAADLQSTQEIGVALHHLRSICETAQRYEHRAVYVCAATIEALLHLQSAHTDSVEQAQRALASARSLQLEGFYDELPQLLVYMHLLDLVCCLRQPSLSYTVSNLAEFQQVVDRAVQSSKWSKNGQFSICLPNSTGPKVTCSDQSESLQGQPDCITFNALPKKDMHIMAYFMSGVFESFHTSYAGTKAEKYLQGGLETAKDVGNEAEQEYGPGSLASVSSRFIYRNILTCHLRIHLIFIQCSRTDWSNASRSYKTLMEGIDDLQDECPEELSYLAHYLGAVISHGSGDLNKALEIYQSSLFDLDLNTKDQNTVHGDLALLSALNSVLIIRSPSHPLHHKLGDILSALEPSCKDHPNKGIQSAFYLVKASSVESDTLINIKKHLQLALHAAQRVVNSQLQTIILTFMGWKFFTGVMGEQSEKSALAGLTMAKKSANKLWISVAGGMMADTCDLHSKHAEAHAARAEAVQLAQQIDRIKSDKA